MQLSSGSAMSEAAGITDTPPVRSPQWVIVQVLRDALEPNWTPMSAATHLVDRAPDPHMLRHTRARLRVTASRRTTVHRLRALATLSLAISRLEDN